MSQCGVVAASISRRCFSSVNIIAEDTQCRWLAEELMGALYVADRPTIASVIQLVGEPVQCPPVNMSVCLSVRIHDGHPACCLHNVRCRWSMVNGNGRALPGLCPLLGPSDPGEYASADDIVRTSDHANYLIRSRSL